MDIHRCRFSEWVPSAACALAFHPDLPLLVVGRENGNIELWNTEEKWFCEAVDCFLSRISRRQFLVMRITRFDRLFGPKRTNKRRYPISNIVCSVRGSKDKSMKYTSEISVLRIKVTPMVVLYG